MLPDKNVMCHYTGFTKSCREGVTEHSCQKWVHVQGTHPQTGDHIDKFSCADSVAHLLMIENSRQQMQTSKSIDSFRNEMVELNKPSQGLLR